MFEFYSASDNFMIEFIDEQKQEGAKDEQDRF